MSSQPDETLPPPPEQESLAIAPPSLEMRFTTYMAPTDSPETTYGLEGRQALAPFIHAFASNIARERVPSLPEDKQLAQKQIPDALVEQQIGNYYRTLLAMPDMEATFARRYAHVAAGRTNLPQVKVLIDLYELLGEHSEADAHQENLRRLRILAIKDMIIIHGKCVVTLDRYIAQSSMGRDDIQ